MRGMKLEPIIQSEVSQKDKEQYSILTHIYGIIAFRFAQVQLFAIVPLKLSQLFLTDRCVYIYIYMCVCVCVKQIGICIYIYIITVLESFLVFPFAIFDLYVSGMYLDIN